MYDAQKAREYREKNSERMNAYSRMYREQNCERLNGYLRRYYQNHKEEARRRSAVEYAKNRERHSARSATQRAIQKGLLTRESCECCGTSIQVQAHHDDYSRPLEVRWLCRVCHRDLHRKYPHGSNGVAA